MERFTTFLAIGLLLNPLSFLPPSPAAPTIHPAEKAALSKTEIKHNFAKIPLSFEQNIGQSGQDVKFSAKAGDVSLLLTNQSAVLKMPHKSVAKNSPTSVAITLTMKMVGANPTPKISGVDRLKRVTNYFKGQDQRDWITGVPNFNRVKHEEVWQGVDAVWYEHEQQLEYDFIVAPQADPKQIALEFAGAESLAIDADGNLVLQTAAGEIVHPAPIIYQQSNDEKESVAGKFVLCENTVSFEIGDYDRARELVIDPRIIYSSFLRGGDSNVTETHFPAATVSAEGNVFASGFGTNFLDIAQTSSSRAFFIVKLNTTGTGVEYVTFLSTEGLTLDGVSGLAVDNAGNAYFTGFTSSRNYPLKNEFQSRVNPGLTIPHFIPKIDAVVTKLDPSGAIVYSTYLGGASDDKPFGIAVDSAGRACVTGYAMSANFPKENQFQGNAIGTRRDIFLTVFEPGGNTLRYSTLLRSGSNQDEGHGIAVDSADNVYITGFAKDTNLPTRSPSSAGPFRANSAGGFDAFVAKFNPSLSGDASLIYCTYLGGTGTDQGFGITVDSANVAYVTGITGSVNFPLQAAAGAAIIDNTNVVNEAFVTGINSTGSALTFSTFLGGSSTEIGKSIALDSARNILVAGDTASSNFPIRNAFQLTPGGASDIFVAKLQAGGKSLMYATYLGGNDDEQLGSVAIDGRDNVYVYGDTLSHSYPVTAGALAETFTNFVSLFTTKISNVNVETVGGYNPVTSVFTLRNSGTSESNITFGQPGDIPLIGDWDGDGVDTIGVFRNGVFILTNQNVNGATPAITTSFGSAGDFPVVGDWNGDGVDTIGIFRPSVPAFFLTDDNAIVNEIVPFGVIGDQPLAGDWDGDGDDEVGVFRAGTFFLDLNLSGVTAELTANFGLASDLPFVGDWDGDGGSTIGVLHPGAPNVFQLRNTNTSGAPDLIPTLRLGSALRVSGIIPLAGDFDGLP